MWALGAPWGSAGAEQSGVGMIGQWTVLWRPVSEVGSAAGLVVFLAGDDEYDELVSLVQHRFPVFHTFL